MSEDKDEILARHDRVTGARLAALARGLAGFVSGLSAAGGVGLFGIGVVGLLLTVGGFSCAHQADSGSGPYSGDPGLATLVWSVVALFLGPASLGSLVGGVLALLLAFGIG